MANGNGRNHRPWWKQSLIELRREKVAELRARGFTQREVVAELSRPLEEGGLHNPETGKPYTIATIAEDYLELDQRWRDEALKSTIDHKAKVLAKLEQVERAGWAMGDIKGLTLVVKAIARECLVLGLQEPIKVSMLNWNVDMGQLSEAQLQRIIEGEDPAQVLGTQPAQVVEGEVVAGSRGASGESLACIPESSHEENAEEEAGPGEGRLE